MWTQKTQNAGWPSATPAAAVATDSTIFAFIGSSSSGEVWSSTDAILWTLVTAQPGFYLPAVGLGLTFSKSTLFAFGAASLSAQYPYNEVWSSQDGITWRQLSSWLPESRDYGASVTIDGQILLFGGASKNTDPALSPTNTVFGANASACQWVTVTSAAPWSPRSYLTAATTANGSVMLTGGYKANDVWLLLVPEVPTTTTLSTSTPLTTALPTTATMTTGVTATSTPAAAPLIENAISTSAATLLATFGGVSAIGTGVSIAGSHSSPSPGTGLFAVVAVFQVSVLTRYFLQHETKLAESYDDYAGSFRWALGHPTYSHPHSSKVSDQSWRDTCTHDACLLPVAISVAVLSGLPVLLLMLHRICRSRDAPVPMADENPAFMVRFRDKLKTLPPLFVGSFALWMSLQVTFLPVILASALGAVHESLVFSLPLGLFGVGLPLFHGLALLHTSERDWSPNSDFSVFRSINGLGRGTVAHTCLTRVLRRSGYSYHHRFFGLLEQGLQLTYIVCAVLVSQFFSENWALYAEIFTCVCLLAFAMVVLLLPRCLQHDARYAKHLDLWLRPALLLFLILGSHFGIDGVATLVGLIVVPLLVLAAKAILAISLVVRFLCRQAPRSHLQREAQADLETFRLLD